MSDTNQDVLNDLVLESREHLSTIEPDLLTLEKEGAQTNADLINRVFRAIHSIKGGFAFFGFENVTKISHAMETLLSKIRAGQLTITTPMMEALFSGIDKLRVLIDDLQRSEMITIENEVMSINLYLNPEPLALNKTEKTDTVSSVSCPAAPVSEFKDEHYKPTPEVLKALCDAGKKIYEIHLKGKDDFISKKISPAQFEEILAPFADILWKPAFFDKKKKIAPGKDYFFVVASILEKDLLANAFNLSEEKIKLIYQRPEIQATIPEKEKTSIKQENHTKGQEGPDMPVIQENKESSTVDKMSSSPGSVTGAVSIPATLNTASDSLRVRVALLNNLVNLAGELVLNRNQLLQASDNRMTDLLNNNKNTRELENHLSRIYEHILETKAIQSKETIRDFLEGELGIIKQNIDAQMNIRLSEIPRINGLIQSINKITSEIQENIMNTRLQPISNVFSKFPRLVRDLSKSINKDIELVVSGQDVELDKSIIELLSDPLTHLVRNSVDHGVEAPEVREKSGKKKQGVIFLNAYHEGGKVIIEVKDDGSGINEAKVKAKAIQTGLVTKEDADKMTEKQIQHLIFHPGFSTATVVTNISGRGVGMDVVKSNIEKLGGVIEIYSYPGKGTRFLLKLPLTLAIISSLIVSTEGKKFAIPQVGVEELVRIRAQELTQKIERVQNAEVLRLREKLLPLIRLSDVLGMGSSYFDPENGERKEDRRKRWSERRGNKTFASETGERRAQDKDRRNSQNNAVKVVVLKAGKSNFGLVVEDVFDNEEIVVKPLSSYLKTTKCYAGAAIMGDGKVAMILDPMGISQFMDLKFEHLDKQAEEEKLQEAAEENEYLVFDLGGSEKIAMALKKLYRIEKVNAADLKTIGEHQYFIQGDATIKVVRLDHHIRLQPFVPDGKNSYLLIPKGLKNQVGILVSHIFDTLKTTRTIDVSNVKLEGIAGTLMDAKELLLVLDLDMFFQLSGEERV